MLILYLLTADEGLGVARKLAKENNSVFVCIQDSAITQDPYVQILESWRPHLTNADLVVCGSLGYERYEEVFKKFGKPYLGASKLASMLRDTGKLKEFLEICDVPLSAAKIPTVAVTGFFNGRDWVRPWFVSSIKERYGTGDLGPVAGILGLTLKQTNGFGTLMESLKVGFSRMGLRDMVTAVLSHDGVIGIGCGIAYDILECIVEGLRDRLTDILFELASGTLKTIDFTADYIVGVKLTVPPFPYIAEKSAEQRILGINEENLKHIFLDSVEIAEEEYFTCGTSGCILKATARGRSVREARRRVYRTLSGITVPDKYYRTDIGEQVKFCEVLPEEEH